MIPDAFAVAGKPHFRTRQPARTVEPGERGELSVQLVEVDSEIKGNTACVALSNEPARQILEVIDSHKGDWGSRPRDWGDHPDADNPVPPFNVMAPPKKNIQLRTPNF